MRRSEHLFPALLIPHCLDHCLCDIDVVSSSVEKKCHHLLPTLSVSCFVAHYPFRYYHICPALVKQQLYHLLPTTTISRCHPHYLFCHYRLKILHSTALNRLFFIRLLSIRLLLYPTALRHRQRREGEPHMLSMREVTCRLPTADCPRSLLRTQGRTMQRILDSTATRPNLWDFIGFG